MVHRANKHVLTDTDIIVLGSTIRASVPNGYRVIFYVPSLCPSRFAVPGGGDSASVGPREGHEVLNSVVEDILSQNRMRGCLPSNTATTL